MRTHRMEPMERPYPDLSVLIMERMVLWISTAAVHKELGVDQNRIEKRDCDGLDQMCLFSALFRCLQMCLCPGVYFPVGGAFMGNSVEHSGLGSQLILDKVSLFLSPTHKQKHPHPPCTSSQRGPFKSPHMLHSYHVTHCTHSHQAREHMCHHICTGRTHLQMEPHRHSFYGFFLSH